MSRLRTLALLPLVAIGCSGGSGLEQAAGVAQEILVQPSTALIRTGQSLQLTVQVNDSGGSPVGGADITFSSSRPDLVRVTSTGEVSAVGPTGAGTVVVSSGDVQRSVGVTVSAGVPQHADVVSGGGQSGIVGSTLVEPLIVRVTDAYGNPVPRSAVHFDVGSGGSVEPAVAETDAAGRARALWTLGPVAGLQSIAISCDSVSAVAEATAAAGHMARIEPVGIIVRRVAAGDTVAVRLRATDAHGNGVSGVVVGFRVESGGGSVAPVRVETAEDGLAETHWVTGVRAGLNTLRVHATEVGDTTLHVEQRTYGGAPARAEIAAGSGQVAAVGAAVRTPPQVRVRDQYGNVVAGARVRFSVTAGGGTVDPPEVLTDDRGIAVVRAWTLGAGENALAALVEGVRDTLRITARGRRP